MALLMKETNDEPEFRLFLLSLLDGVRMDVDDTTSEYESIPTRLLPEMAVALFRRWSCLEISGPNGREKRKRNRLHEALII